MVYLISPSLAMETICMAANPGTPILEVHSGRAAFEAEPMHEALYHLDQTRRDAVPVPPERVMGDFKAYARRRLNSMSRDVPNRKRWARHGSTRWLWQPHVSAAMQYAMSMFEPHQLCAIAIPAALSATASGDERAARAQLENPSAR